MTADFKLLKKKRESFDDVHKQLSVLDCAVSKFDGNIGKLAKRTVYIEDRSRRNNLIIRGIAEEDKETDKDLMRKVNSDIFEQILKVKMNSIERIHRLGKKINGRNRLVI